MNNSSRGPLWFGLALVLIVAGIAAFYFFMPTQDLNVALTLSTNPTTTLVGDPFTLSAAFSNDSNLALQGAVVTLILPSGVVAVDSPGASVVRQTIGNVEAGSVSHEDFNLIVTGAANTVEHVTAKLTYGTPGASAQFETDGATEVAVGQSAISVNLSAPASVTSGQDFPITVSYHNNTTHAIQGATLAMLYPPTFALSHASSSLRTNGNNAWDLGGIPANGAGTLIITGGLVGPNSASYPIGANLTETIAGQTFAIANPTVNVQLAVSPLTLAIAVNNSVNYVASAGQGLTYTLTYTNTSNVTFQNIIVNATLVGQMFNLATVSGNGSFSSLTNTVTWNGGEVPDLLSLAPGQSGSVAFEVQLQSGFPIRLLSDKNYSLVVGAKISSPTVAPGTTANGTISVAKVVTKLMGNIVLNAKAYAHGDPAPQGIVNSGPYPPKVNQATQYTVHWLLTNYATDADNVTISAYLQSGTTCTGIVKSPASSTFACDSANGLISWQIPVVPATTGVTGKPLEAIFQVQNTPATNQVKQTITLIGPATLTATDAFTSSTLNSSAPAITTALPDDTSAGQVDRQVQP